MPFGGVRPGLNMFVVRVERYYGARVESLRVFSDSGIEASKRSPTSLSLAAAAAPRNVEAGDPVVVTARLANAGGGAALPRLIFILPLSLVGPAHRESSRIG